MNILCHSYAFLPSIGGIEAVSDVLLSQFSNLGHQIKVVTHTSDTDNKDRPYEVFRRPKTSQQIKLLNWCDVVWQNNISLKYLLPNLITRKPVIVTTQTWLGGQKDAKNRNVTLKRFTLKHCTNIAISRAIHYHLGLESEILGNPYDNHTFKLIPEIKRNKELLFVGRLVSDKGLDTLLQALQLLKSHGQETHLTVVGVGESENQLKKLANNLNLNVQFLGPKHGNHLATIMNEHRNLIIPSRWAEPFGVVALEGLACGCQVIASRDGGLIDAMGPDGIPFNNGDPDDLARTLKAHLDQTIHFPSQATHEHLRQHQSTQLAQRYLQIFQKKNESL